MAAMKTSEQGIAELLSSEALVPYPYRDSVGVWTWSVGLTKAAGQGDPAKFPRGVELPIPRCIQAFKAALPRYESEVRKALKVGVAQHVFDAIVSFHWNTGAVARAGFVALINAGHRPSSKAVCDAMMAWSKPPEIIARRRKEMMLMKTGRYDPNPMVPIIRADANGRVLWNTRKNVPYSEIMSPATAMALAEVSEDVTPARMIPQEPNDAVEDVPARLPYIAGVELLTREQIEPIQKALYAKGYTEVGLYDGEWGIGSDAALRQFLLVNAIPEAGFVLMPGYAQTIAAGKGKPVSQERANPETQVLNDRVPGRKEAWYVKFASAIGTAVMGFFGWLASVVEDVQALFLQFGHYLSGMKPSTWLFIGAGVFLFVMLLARRVQKKGDTAFVEGKVR